MRIFFTTIIFLFALALNVPGQEINTVYASDSKPIYFGFGIGFGFFYPDDVNDYISEQLQGYDIYSGTKEIYMNFSGRASLYFKMTQNIDLGIFLEAAWAPKWIYDEADYYFSFSRVSPGIAPKIYFPVGSGKNAFFISPGVMYNNMKFEGYQASNIGGKLQAGASLKLGSIKLQPYGAINIANASDKTAMGDFDLNYTDFHIGVEVLL
ncbi:hypothetical protein [Plebeiibacterium marinum]|uniref:Outer membrane protein beta-barrel domain-containing protein n=1 Tax=Plebeiibacterium marinum TaxID=2992111 RepID=A0AAE3MAW5_9BACT|nr:hypothetical protein [Plebeiobacterium marinum]MCW3804057.1 hypothetical protein [Plebeiobacterium marinum]